MTPVLYGPRWHVQDDEGNLSAFCNPCRARVEAHIDKLKRGLVKWESYKGIAAPGRGFRSKMSNRWIVTTQT
jgi:hypothetical protein